MSSSSSSSSSSASTIKRSNLDRFLYCMTPTVPSQSLPQRCNRVLNSQWQNIGKVDTVEYFTLKDVWECYGEWSAYGVGTPVVLDTGENITQYYVPYLSAIQIYTDKSFMALRNPIREDSDVMGFDSDSWSDDSESDKLSRSLSNNSSRAWDAASEDSSFDQDGSWAMRDKLGDLYFQYFEFASPYWRIPLMDKINDLSRNNLGLMTLKSVDLSPASWMAVAWYPIYHIPTQRNVKDLSTCFLTYHTLSSSFQDTGMENDDNDGVKDICCSEAAERITGAKSKGEGSGRISLPPFGLATYKMQGNLWTNPETSDHERISYLQSAADSWLKQLSVHHHDFSFFVSHSTL